MLVDGPIAPDPDWSARERWFAQDVGVDRKLYRSKSRPCLASLDEGVATVLWFEDDLFCHANLLYLLSRAPADGSWSLVCPDLALGGRRPDEFRSLHGTRRILGPADVQLGRRAWEAYAGADPKRVQALANDEGFAWPGLRRSLRLHLMRFPEHRTGLDGIESWFLSALKKGPARFRELFAAFALSEQKSGWGIGDQQVAWRLRSLARGPRPLLAIEGDPGGPGDWMLRIGNDGLDVLSGRRDRFDLVGFDRWVGGVHVEGPRAAWRWDAAEGVLVRG